MPTIPLHDIQRIETAGANTAASRGTNVTAGAANVKGSYTQLIASSAAPATGIIVMFDDPSAGNVDFLVDVAVGPAASEVVLFSNLLAPGGTGGTNYGGYYWLPVKVAGSIRIAARCQCTTASAIIRVSCLLLYGGFAQTEGLSVVDTYGANTTDSGGTSIDPGGVANTKGSYTQITASTTRPHKYLLLAIGGQINAVRNSQSWLVDVAVGPAASEVVIFNNIPIACTTSADVICPTTILLPKQVPAGTRLSVRAQSDGIDATDRLFDVVLYGIG